MDTLIYPGKSTVSEKTGHPSLRAAVAGIVAAVGLLIPSVAQAGTTHWANNLWLQGGHSLRDPATHILYGVYCHEFDYDNRRKIQINATYSVGSQYGSWVQFTTDGYRTYSNAYRLAGACRNPHSVAYHSDAHDNWHSTPGRREQPRQPQRRASPVLTGVRCYLSTRTSGSPTHSTIVRILH